MYDYRSDKYNSRGCFDKCNCHLCRANGVRHKIRKNTARAKTSSLNVQNRMRSVKKKMRRQLKIFEY